MYFVGIEMSVDEATVEKARQEMRMRNQRKRSAMGCTCEEKSNGG